jgi:hypothetical protein
MTKMMIEVVAVEDLRAQLKAKKERKVREAKVRSLLRAKSLLVEKVKPRKEKREPKVKDLLVHSLSRVKGVIKVRA